MDTSMKLPRIQFTQRATLPFNFGRVKAHKQRCRKGTKMSTKAPPLFMWGTTHIKRGEGLQLHGSDQYLSFRTLPTDTPEHKVVISA